MKIGDVTGNGYISITQTYHGEAGGLPDVQCAIDIMMFMDEYVHAGVYGVVELVAGDYVSIIPDNCKFRVLYVHVDRARVSRGQRVEPSTIIAQIQRIAFPHLHLGLKYFDSRVPAPRVMDYIDRSIPIRSTAGDITAEWFIGGDSNNFDWSKHSDLTLDGNSEMATKFKMGDKIIFTKRQNKRGGAGTGFQDLGAYNEGDIAIIKDKPRKSQNSQFYGKGSDNPVDDANIWLDTTDLTNGGSYWVADIGSFRLYDSSIDGSKPSEPEPCLDCINYKLEIGRLQQEVDTFREESHRLAGLKKDFERIIGEKETEVGKLRWEVDFEKNRVSILEGEVVLLREELEKCHSGNNKQLSEELSDMTVKYEKELELRKSLEVEKMEAVRQLNELKNSKHMWIVELLDRVFSGKEKS